MLSSSQICSDTKTNKQTQGKMHLFQQRCEWLPYLPHPAFLCAGLSGFEGERERESEGGEREKWGAVAPLRLHHGCYRNWKSASKSRSCCSLTHRDTYSNKNTHTHTVWHTNAHTHWLAFLHCWVPFIASWGISCLSLSSQSGKLEHSYTRKQWPRFLIYLSYSPLCCQRCQATVRRAQGGEGVAWRLPHRGGDIQWLWVKPKQRTVARGPLAEMNGWMPLHLEFPGGNRAVFLGIPSSSAPCASQQAAARARLSLYGS